MDNVNDGDVRVRFVDEDRAGLEGKIVRDDGTTLTVEVSLFGRKVPMEARPDEIVRIEPRAPREVDLDDLAERLSRCRPEETRALIDEAFEDDSASSCRAIVSGRLRARDGDHALTRILYERVIGAEGAGCTADEVAEYLTTLDEVVARGEIEAVQPPYFFGPGFFQTQDRLIGHFLYDEPAPFRDRLERYCPYLRHGITCLLHLAGEDPPLLDGFLEWLASEYRDASPTVRVPYTSDLQNARGILHMRGDDDQLTANARRFVSMFSTVEAFEALRGPDAWSRAR